MIVSTKGRYALRVIMHLAEFGNGDYIPLKEIAEKQNISLKYLESIMAVLSKAGMVDSLHGKGGGYRLNMPPDKYTVAAVLKLTEGTLAPIACLETDENHCDRAEGCRTLPMWTELDRLIYGYLESITIDDLIKSDRSE